MNQQKPPAHQCRRFSIRVVPLGLEPRTPWLWVRCSNQLSYRTGLSGLSFHQKRLQNYKINANPQPIGAFFFVSAAQIASSTIACRARAILTDDLLKKPCNATFWPSASPLSPTPHSKIAIFHRNMTKRLHFARISHFLNIKIKQNREIFRYFATS